ncbi:MAG: HD domain-containing protein [Candidatus Methanomethylophilaceae archaeon]|nr:HD domain-containing protein [Candidatus Methanomethylophilaceae archaeon]
MSSSKMIQDPVHGSIVVDGIFLDIMDRPEMQRLRLIKQLGLGYLVFPGANHTRFEHCLGAYHLAGRMAQAIGLNKEDSDTVRMAGLLHDVCHPPFSHSLESLMEDATGMDHMDLARALITGKIPNHRSLDDDLFDGIRPIGEEISRFGIDPEEVCDLIAYPVSNKDNLDPFIGKHDYFPSKDYEHQIIHGPVDADQMDYLMRDAYYTGISHGTIDCDRLINTMQVHNDRIVIRRGGTVAAEGLMVSRSLMYTSVYFHETTRIAQKMLTKVVANSGLDLSEMYLWNDSDLIQKVVSSGGKSSNCMRRILNRDINKKAFAIYSADMTEDIASKLIEFTNKEGVRRLEQEIADQADVDVFHIGVETTSKTNLQNNMNIGKTDVSIIDEEGKVRSLARFSPIARSLQARDPYSWAIMVSAPAPFKEQVERAARKVLSL